MMSTKVQDATCRLWASTGQHSFVHSTVMLIFNHLYSDLISFFTGVNG